ncbi:FMN-binding domain-containing protein [Enhydrobacter aerosaccus]|uniref:FMN-binding domain-containing protein n=1 Tax=Enhydrobacter aerosaccus TaxID=225324 RepID=A0A1T4SAH1_9HYPH|nr:FMN-binding protein [Enhydrobacter aerosaccus]SKA25202.1 FMN-binding domain-containing protein [Enhydrobacter aerosaccus]
MPLLAAPAAVIITVPAHATIYFTTEQAQQKMFPGASFSPAPAQLSDADRRAMYDRSGVHEPFDPSRVWRASTGGWFVIDEVVGKHEHIKYAVAIGADGAVRSIEIMEYNESYGYEVRDPSWRQQFVGKTASSSLKFGSDIRNISGATLSSKHITDGVRRVLAMYDLVLKGR